MKNKRYVLETKPTYSGVESNGYYTGKSYFHQGGKYAVISNDIKEAKIYSNQTRANKASQMVFENYSFEAIELDVN